MREKFTSCLALSACAAFVAATNTLASGMTGWISGGGHAGNGIPPPGEVRYLGALPSGYRVHDNVVRRR